MARWLERTLAAGLAAAAVAAALALVGARFRRGEVLPEASSLSTAPGGSEALAAALAALPDVEVVRALRRQDLERCAAGCTLLYLGAPAVLPLAPAELWRLDAVLRRGARVVLAFEPLAGDLPCGVCGETTRDEASEAGGRRPRTPGPERPPPGWWRELRFELAGTPVAPADGADGTTTGAAGAAAGIDGSTSVLRVVAMPDAALVLDRVGDEIRAVELPVGSGRLVVAADGSIFGNRALRERRDAALLAALIGDPRQVVFEETHLGVVERGGVVALARRYGLTGAAAALLGLALLQIWRASAPLAPRRREEVAGGAVSEGVGTGSGFAALLERGLPRRRLLATCVAALRGTGSERIADETWQELERIAGDGGDPVAGYERMRVVLDDRRS